MVDSANYNIENSNGRQRKLLQTGLIVDRKKNAAEKELIADKENCCRERINCTQRKLHC